jgi:alpha-D-ribose 1-methylphosphonate 5-triphosphate synthase subunit PhnG
MKSKHRPKLSRKRYNRLVESSMEFNSAAIPPDRAAAMRLLALAPWTVLNALTEPWCHETHSILRGPETGLVMLRGRMGATGNAFNLGEATVTRCTLKLPSGTEGHAYVMGRNFDHARRAALCDAIFQENAEKLGSVLAALEKYLTSQHQTMAAKAAATKVDFFTMVRGDV